MISHSDFTQTGLDARLAVRNAMYGCHTALDHHRKEPREFECTLPEREKEKACEGCGRVRDMTANG